MAYQQIELPENTPEEIKKIVREQIDPLFKDVHAMLRLPIKNDAGLDADCTLSPALVLLSVVSGISEAIYDGGKRRSGDSGARFKEVLAQYYPWSAESGLTGFIPGEDAAALLYDHYRNPLAHNLGSLRGTDAGSAQLAKGGIGEDEIVAIEQANERPEFTVPTLFLRNSQGGGGRETLLLVKAFYWGVRRMLVEVINARITSSRAASADMLATAPEMLNTPSITSTATRIRSELRNQFDTISIGSTDSAVYSPKK